MAPLAFFLEPDSLKAFIPIVAILAGVAFVIVFRQSGDSRRRAKLEIQTHLIDRLQSAEEIERFFASEAGQRLLASWENGHRRRRDEPPLIGYFFSTAFPGLIIGSIGCAFAFLAFGMGLRQFVVPMAILIAMGLAFFIAAGIVFYLHGQAAQRGDVHPRERS